MHSLKPADCAFDREKKTHFGQTEWKPHLKLQFTPRRRDISTDNSSRTKKNDQKQTEKVALERWQKAKSEGQNIKKKKEKRTTEVSWHGSIRLPVHVKKFTNTF